MCGIAGIVGDPTVSAGVIGRMAASLAHRGPDDEGVWLDREAGVGLGHRRLSIVDLSAAGHQPMSSHSGRLVISFNGEIYNHQELRSELAQQGYAPEWRGHSDTETLLAGFDRWGIVPTLRRASGMFALALWDRQERVLTLARDRLGEKPLYFGRAAGGTGPFLFASELKALKCYPGFEPEIDRRALALMLRYLAVPAPFSIYRGVSKLEAGAVLTLAPGALEPIIERYWSGADVARAGVREPASLGIGEATDELERRLERAVGRQLMADVPLGAFLSGGVDSSTIVAIMQKLSSRPVKTFTMGFDAVGFDEAVHARAVAKHLGTDHHEVYVTAGDALDVIPKLPAIYDEPFADSSQIPTFLVSTIARRQVTVALSGDGGDELFGGYDRYALAATLWKKISAVPLPLRNAAASALSVVPPAIGNKLPSRAGGLLPRALRVAQFGDKLHKGAPLLRSGSLDELYNSIMSQWREPGPVIGVAVAGRADDRSLEGLDGVERMMAGDMLDYLPNDILVKVDRAAMAVSLETRMPLLDPEVVEFAWKLPLALKVRSGESKLVLREVLYRHIPRALIDRPKMGFGVPLDWWLRGPLRDWAESMLSEGRLRAEGYFDPRMVREVWASELRGNSKHGLKIWTVLMFQAWLDAQLPV
jgi:asparagine synthase (glutamine-hydrolysing)